MAEGYIDADDIEAYGFQADIENNQALFDRLVPRASQFFDTLCGVEIGYFLPVEDAAVATEKVIRGSGGVLLALSAYIGGIVSVTAPSGFQVPNFIEQAGYLRVTDFQGRAQDVGVPYPETGAPVIFQGTALVWQRGVAYTVTAKWGYAEVPENVKQATVEIFMIMWREKDPAFTKAVDLDVTKPESIPARVRMIARSIRNQQPSTSALV